jgi:transposase
MKLHVIGIDLGKTVFHLVGLDSTGRVAIRKKCSRTQLLAFPANLEVQLIGMESCSGSHFWGRAVREQGHEVRLMAAQYVKPYVQSNKSDFLDAKAIAETVERPRMRLVPIKTEEQLDLQAPHRVWPSEISGLIASTLLASRMSKQDLGTGPLDQLSCRLFL